MTKADKLQIEIDLLLSLQHTTAYTGELGQLKQKSYVEYDHVLKLLNDKRLELSLLNK